MSINATEKPLGKIFTSDYRFVIPSFQRAYTWQTENIAQLVTDLQDACHDPDTPYFLGSLILVHDGQTKYQVIDGQQRLISLSIIISVLRELEDDPELIESLNDLIVEPGDKLRGIKAEPRLKLRERDTNFFRMYVQEGDLEGLFDLRDNDIESYAQRNIAINTRQVFDELAKMPTQDRRAFASYLVNEVTLVIVTTDDLAGAHRIFDVMNMRGVPSPHPTYSKQEPSRKSPQPHATPTPPDGTTSWTRSAMTHKHSKRSSAISTSSSRIKPSARNCLRNSAKTCSNRTSRNRTSSPSSTIC